MEDLLRGAAENSSGEYIDKFITGLFLVFFVSATFQLFVLSIECVDTKKNIFKTKINAPVRASLLSGLFLFLISQLASWLGRCAAYIPLFNFPFANILLSLPFLLVVVYSMGCLVARKLNNKDILSVAGIACELGCSFLFFWNTLLKQSPFSHMGICAIASFLYLATMYYIHSGKKL